MGAGENVDEGANFGDIFARTRNPDNVRSLPVDIRTLLAAWEGNSAANTIGSVAVGTVAVVPPGAVGQKIAS